MPHTSVPIAERLRSYHPFSDDTLAAVERVTHEHRGGYKKLFERYRVGDPIVEVLPNGDSTAILEIPASGDSDPSRARVIHGGIGNPIDPNNVYSALTVHALDPSMRTFVTGNPTGLGRRFRAGWMSGPSRARLADGDFKPLADPILRRLSRVGVTQTVQIGGSYGVAKVNAIATRVAAFDQEVDQMVHIEPAHVAARTLPELGKAFAQSNEALGDYVTVNGNPDFAEARKDSISLGTFAAGLLRRTNVAAVKGLAAGKYEKDTRHAMIASGADLFLAWGSQSELATDEILTTVARHLASEFGDSVNAVRLPNQRHALMNDIYLNAALVHTALSGCE